MPRLAIEPSEFSPPGYDARKRIENAGLGVMRREIKRLKERLAEEQMRAQAARKSAQEQRDKRAAAEFQLGAYRRLRPDRLCHIATAVAELHKVDVKDLINTELRGRPLVSARHEFFYELLKARRDISAKRIAGMLNLDHTVLLYGAQRHIERTGAPQLDRHVYSIVRKDNLKKLQWINGRAKALGATS